MREFDYFAEYAANPDRATSHLYDKFRSQFTSFISHIYSALTADDVEDIYVDSVMVVWEKVGRGVLTRENMTSGWGTYLIAVGKLKAIHLLSERKEVIEVSIDDENAKEIVDESESQLRQEIRELLNMLDARCRQLLDAFYVYGYSMDEIAKRMKMANANTAKVQKYNCMKRFEELYEKLYGENSSSDLLTPENRALTGVMDTILQEELVWELKSQHMRRELKNARHGSRSAWMWILSAAACLALLVTVGVKNVYRGQEVAAIALSEYEMGEYRGDYDITRLKGIGDMVVSGSDLSAAQDSLQNFATEISARTYADDLEGYYYMTTDSELLEDIEYLQAICTLKQGRLIKAYRQLCTIRDAGGLYAMDAEKLLEEW